jgi:hypothetical protein
VSVFAFEPKRSPDSPLATCAFEMATYLVGRPDSKWPVLPVEPAFYLQQFLTEVEQEIVCDADLYPRSLRLALDAFAMCSAPEFAQFFQVDPSEEEAKLEIRRLIFMYRTVISVEIQVDDCAWHDIQRLRIFLLRLCFVAQTARTGPSETGARLLSFHR